VALVSVPALLGGFHGAQLINVAVSVLLALFYLANDTRANVQHARTLRETQAALEEQTGARRSGQRGQDGLPGPDEATNCARR
jgi:hypothetical protein